MKIKVIIRNGVVESALSDKGEDIDMEVVDIDDDYEDHDALCAYADSLYNSHEFREIGYTVARFGEE